MPLTHEQICCRQGGQESCSGSGLLVLTWAPGLLLPLESGGNSTPKFLGKECHGLLGNCQFSLITAVDLTSQLGGNSLFGLPLTTIFPFFSSLSVPVTREKRMTKGKEREDAGQNNLSGFLGVRNC